MDPVSIILSLLTNKYVLGGLAILGAITGIYLKGRSAGVGAVKDDEQDARNKLNKQVNSAEAQNQKIGKEKEDATQTIDNTDDPNRLADLLNDLTKGDK